MDNYSRPVIRYLITKYLQDPETDLEILKSFIFPDKLDKLAFEVELFNKHKSDLFSVEEARDIAKLLPTYNYYNPKTLVYTDVSTLIARMSHAVELATDNLLTSLRKANIAMDMQAYEERIPSKVKEAMDAVLYDSNLGVYEPLYKPAYDAFIGYGRALKFAREKGTKGVTISYNFVPLDYNDYEPSISDVNSFLATVEPAKFWPTFTRRMNHKIVFEVWEYVAGAKLSQLEVKKIELEA